VPSPEAGPAGFRPARQEALLIKKADARIRTADPIITSDVLYQLSYVGRGVLSRAGVYPWPGSNRSRAY
jgi:hypothetical protein